MMHGHTYIKLFVCVATRVTKFLVLYVHTASVKDRRTKRRC